MPEANRTVYDPRGSEQWMDKVFEDARKEFERILTESKNEILRVFEVHTRAVEAAIEQDSRRRLKVLNPSAFEIEERSR